MEFSINPTSFSSVFTVPCSAVDNNILLASEMQIKVLLCAMRNLANGINAAEIAETLSVPISQAEDCLLFWSKAGIFCSKDAPAAAVQEEAKPAVLKAVKPTRADVANRGIQDPKVRFLMQEAQACFGHSLKTTESTTLLWLYDDQGMDISVIMLLLQYALSEKQLNIRFIEKTALYWLKNGVENVTDAEKQIADAAKRKSAWHIVSKVFGIDSRMPSTKEAELADLWINQWQLSAELIKYAYDVCIDSKSKLIMSYIAKILEKWHAEGYKTPQDVRNGKEKHSADGKNSFAAYDIDAFEKMLNSNDG